MTVAFLTFCDCKKVYVPILQTTASYSRDLACLPFWNSVIWICLCLVKKNNAHLSFIVHPCHFILCHLSSSFWVICSCGQNEAGIVPQKLQNLSKGQNDNRLFGIVMGIPTWWRYNDRLCWKLSIWLMKIFAVAAGASQHYAVPWSLGTLRSVLSYLKTKNNSHSSVISTVCRGKNM